jgi:SAM-dependent methyltransferase
MKDTPRTYDDAIRDHYRAEATKVGLDRTSTMADIRTRDLETQFLMTAITALVEENLESVIWDIGCGNGYTLQCLRQSFPNASLRGCDFTPEFVKLALDRFSEDSKTTIATGDIRQALPAQPPADILYSQRVLINLLDAQDQAVALNNLIDATRIGGHLIFIEALESGRRSLNEARAEFGLDEIPPAHHNLYLEDDFFAKSSRIERIFISGAEQFFLSTHYFVTRVLHAHLFAGKPFVRNSHFVRFLSEALRPATGIYSPVQGFIFRRIK